MRVEPRVPGRKDAGLDATVSAGPRVLLLPLTERTSGRGNRYLSGWFGQASVVAFSRRARQHGNPTWNVYVSEPQPRAEGEAATAAEARTLARPRLDRSAPG